MKFIQILHVWINLNLALWEIIDKSIKEIIVFKFMNLLLRKQFNWFDHFSHLSQNSNIYDSQFHSQSLSFSYKQIEDESFMSAFCSSHDSHSFVSPATAWSRQNEYQQAYMKHQSLQFQYYSQKEQQANQFFYQQIRKFQQNYHSQD